MPVQRKVFRIEESAQSPLQRRPAADHQPGASVCAPTLGEALIDGRANSAELEQARVFKHELSLICRAIERSGQDVAGLVDGLAGDQTARAGRELAAIVAGTETATQRILQAAEDIDQAAGTLSAALKSSHEKGLAHDIQERVVQIFEACNFQDLTGQRVAHVLSVLQLVERHAARLLEIWCSIETMQTAALGDPNDHGRGFLNGPKLPGDLGHSNQNDIDLMFRPA